LRTPRGRWRFSDDSLLRSGVILMSVALTLVLVVAALTAYLRSESEEVVAAAKKSASPESLVRGEPPGDAWTEESLSRSEPPEEHPQPAAKEQSPEPEPQRRAADRTDWPLPDEEQLRAASGPRRYELPSGAIMGLTIKALEVYNAPVFDSDAAWALDNGVAHVPETSLPWSPTLQRNVYLEGHRIGWPGTGSHMIFYHLNRLGEGDEIVLRDREGTRYRYRVSETFEVDPEDVWVMGQVRGRDMVTLQTCTPMPTWEKRLIVRADRV
jgi:sortase A